MVEPVCHVGMTSTASAEASTPASGEKTHNKMCLRCPDSTLNENINPFQWIAKNLYERDRGCQCGPCWCRDFRKLSRNKIIAPKTLKPANKPYRKLLWYLWAWLSELRLQKFCMVAHLAKAWFSDFIVTNWQDGFCYCSSYSFALGVWQVSARSILHREPLQEQWQVYRQPGWSSVRVWAWLPRRQVDVGKAFYSFRDLKVAIFSQCMLTKCIYSLAGA